MDEFEFNQVPKFINFNDEVARNDSHEKSAYFNTGESFISQWLFYLQIHCPF